VKALLVSLLLATRLACAAGVELRDDSGLTQRFDGPPPQRIVSLLPSLTESVCAQGGCKRLVGVDRYSNQPPEVRALPHLGGLDEISVEAIVALKPDLVLVPASHKLHERLRGLGLKVVVLDAVDQAGAHRMLDLVGQLLAVADPGKPWRDIEAALTRTTAALPRGAKGLRVYFEVDGAPYAASESSFIGETLARLGVRNVVPGSLGPFPKLNPEFVVRADPQLIFIGDGSAKSLAQRPGWAAITAVREGRVCTLSREEGDVIVRPGPRLADAAALMARCIERHAH
jgi:iron complex transport system substrate-binding protein